MDPSMCKMNMMLHFSTCEKILWAGWITDTITKFVLSAIGIFFFAIAYEGLRFYREHIFQKNIASERKTGAKEGRTWKLVINQHHVFQSGLHFLQVACSYVLMLIIMLANLYLCFAILAGAMCGYFFFGWMRSKYTLDNECCY